MRDMAAVGVSSLPLGTVQGQVAAGRILVVSLLGGLGGLHTLGDGLATSLPHHIHVVRVKAVDKTHQCGLVGCQLLSRWWEQMDVGRGLGLTCRAGMVQEVRVSASFLGATALPGRWGLGSQVHVRALRLGPLISRATRQERAWSLNVDTLITFPETQVGPGLSPGYLPMTHLASVPSDTYCGSVEGVCLSLGVWYELLASPVESPMGSFPADTSILPGPGQFP